MKLAFQFCFVLILLGIVESCKKERSCEDCKENNKPPIAIAGPDQIITLPTDSILLDGSASNDPDGKISEWLWKKISGPASFNIIRSTDSITVVKNLLAGIYMFELTVKDNGGLSAKDTMQVTVDTVVISNHPPIANAGPDQIITLPTNSVTLDGSGSTDPDNNIMSYLWTKISGPSLYNIVNVNAVQTLATNLTEGNYQFELKVTDSDGLFDLDTISITVNGQLPPLNCGNSNRPLVNAQLIPFATLTQARRGMAIAFTGNKILFAGGVETSSGSLQPASRVDIYDFITNTWATSELCVGRYSIAATASGNKIFFGGGEVSDGTCAVDSVDIYDITSNTWTVSHLSAAGNSITAASVGNKVLFAGGDPTYCGNGSGINRSITIDIYNTVTNTWSVTNLSESKYGISAVTLNNRVYFSGGSSSTGVSKIVEIYDNNTNTWSLDTMYDSKAFHGGIAVNDKIFWAGGVNSSINSSCLVEIKNTSTGNSSIEYLFEPSNWVSSDGQHLLLKDNKIIFLRCYGNNRDKFDIYDISSNTWSIGVLPQPVPLGASFFSVNNTIYIAGGSTGSVLTNQVWKLEF